MNEYEIYSEAVGRFGRKHQMAGGSIMGNNDKRTRKEWALAFGVSYQIMAGAIDKYGKVHQLLKLAEECAELNHAIMRYLETREMDVPSDAKRAHMFEEAADVEIMLMQLRIMYPYNTINSRKLDKLSQLKERVNGWRDPDLEAVADRMRVEARENADAGRPCHDAASE